MKPIIGTLTRAGTFPIRDEECIGLLISMTEEELKAVERLPMYRRVLVTAIEDAGEWTVRASDYDALLSAACALRRACKDRLPPAQYGQLCAELVALDKLTKPQPETPTE